MELNHCPKCHSEISEKASVCPVCQSHVGYWGYFVKLSQIAGLIISITAVIIALMQTQIADQVKNDAYETYKKIEQSREYSQIALKKAEKVLLSVNVNRLDIEIGRVTPLYIEMIDACANFTNVNDCWIPIDDFRHAAENLIKIVNPIVGNNPKIMEKERQRFWDICQPVNASVSFLKGTTKISYIHAWRKQRGYDKPIRDERTRKYYNDLFNSLLVRRCQEIGFAIPG